jgi:hypothetical protein
MPSYRVCFINEIPRNEKLFRCCQRSIFIRSARTPGKGDRGREEAIRQTRRHPRLENSRSSDRDRANRHRDDTRRRHTFPGHLQWECTLGIET